MGKKRRQGDQASEVGVMQPQAKEHLKALEDGRVKEQILS
jgi:predicted ArsR family transcriptional regulator